VFLTAAHILGPIAGVSFFIVKKSTNAELLSGSSIPTCPISGARGLVTKDAIEPVAMFSVRWWIWIWIRGFI